MGSYLTGGDLHETIYNRHVYLNAYQPARIHYIHSRYGTGNTGELTNTNFIEHLQIAYADVNETINLTECSIIFENSTGEPIIDFIYNGETYLIEPIKEKLIVQILNIQKQLILFNTKQIIFTEYEKHAINKYCLVKFKFVNSLYASLTKTIYKSLEIKD